MTTESLNKDYDGFNEVTLEKLDIYARYLREWLPVSMSQQRQVVFHDTDSACVKTMATRLGGTIQTDDGRCLAHVQYHSQPHNESLQSALLQLKKNRSANLLFLDQDGLGCVDHSQLSELRNLKSTDLLTFISSGWFERFSDSREAETWGMSGLDIASCNYSHIHRFVTSYFRRLVGYDCYLAPFSMKTKSGVNTLLFITHNPLRLETFLKVAWHRDPFTSHTNFDLYDDRMATLRLALVGAKKVVEFQKELMACLECGKFRSDKDIYLHTLQRGFLGRHATDTVRVFCNRRNVQFRTRTGNLARPRLSRGCFYRPRPMVFH